MKKVISLVLVSVMLVMCIPLSAVAAVASTDVAKIGETGYATLDAAITAALGGKGDIVLLKDASYNVGNDKSWGDLKSGSSNFTIDGQGHTMTVNTPMYNTHHTVTFKNMKISMNDTIDLSGKGHITFDGCTVTINNNNSEKGNLRHTGTGNITFNNTTVTNNKADCPALYLRGADKCNSTITVDNSTIVSNVGSADSSEGNNAVIQTNQNSTNMVMTYNLRVINNSVLKCAVSGNSAEQQPRVIRVGQYTTTFNLYSDPSCQFILAPQGTNFKNSGFLSDNKSNSEKNFKMYGSPTFIAEANALTKTIYLPKDICNLGSGTIDATTIAETGFKGFAMNGDTTSLYTSNSVSANKYSSKLTIMPVYQHASVAKIGTTSYATFAEAMKAAKNGDTVTLLHDCEITEDLNMASGANNITVDGGSLAHTIYVKKYIRAGNNNVTFKGCRMVLTTAIEQTNGYKGNYIFDECNITLNTVVYTENNQEKVSHGNFRHCGSGNYTFNNTTMIGNTGATMMFLRPNSSGKLTINNSNFIQRKGSGDTNIGNNSVLHIVNSAASDNNYNVADMVYNIELKNNAVLKNESNNNSSKSAGIITAQNSAGNPKLTVNITSDATAKLLLDSKSTALTSIGFINSVGTPTINLAGDLACIASPYIASKGITLTPLGGAEWILNGGTVTGTYKNSSATEDVKLIATQGFTLEDAEISMRFNAYLKTEGSAGIAFGMDISNATLENLKGDVTYGIIITSEHFLDYGAEFTIDGLGDDESITLSTDSSGLVSGVGGKICMLGIENIPLGSSDAAFLKLEARGFILNDGKLVYTQNTIKTSLYELALQAAEEGYADNATVKEILAVAQV